MKNWIFFTFFLILCLKNYSQDQSIQWVTDSRNANDRIALVIANNNYLKNGKLEFPIPTSNEVQSTLENLGFDILIGRDLDRKSTISILKDFSEKQKNYGFAFVFYMGHGFEVDGKNYLIPVDANPTSKNEVDLEAVNLEYIFKISDPEIPKVIVLDACRNNPFASNWSSSDRATAGKGFSYVSAPRNAEVFFTTQKYSTVRDDNPYLKYFLGELRLGGCLDDIVRETSKNIYAYDPSQIPARYGQLFNKICFDSPAISSTSSSYSGSDYFYESKNLMPIKDESGKFGYLDPVQNQIVIPFNFDYADDFYGDLAWVEQDGKYGTIDKYGNEVIPIDREYSTLIGYGFHNGWAWAMIGDKMGAIDPDGNTTFPFKYETVKSLNDELRGVRSGEKWGFSDNEGHIILPAIYEEVWNFSEGLAFVQKNGKVGAIDKKGKVIVPFAYDYERYYATYTFVNGLAEVRKNDKWGLIKANGQTLLEPEYDHIGNLKENETLIAKKAGNLYIVDTKEEVIIQANYEDIRPFDLDITAAKKEGKWGFINKKGKSVTPFEYEEVKPFWEGLAAVKKGEKWGYLNDQGEVVIPFKYKNVGAFAQSLAAVLEKKKWSFVDKNGNQVITPKYSDQTSFSAGLAAVQKKGYWGFINERGETLLPYTYSKIYYPFGSSFGDEVAIVEKNGNSVFINRKGEVVAGYSSPF